MKKERIDKQQQIGAVLKIEHLKHTKEYIELKFNT